MSVYKICAADFLASLISSQALANCGKLLVNLTNDTQGECSLVSYKILHGVLNTALPKIINKDDTESLEVEQNHLFGPDIILSYKCDNKLVIIESQQSACRYISGAGGITGMINSIDKLLSATYTTRAPSLTQNSYGL